MSITLLEGVQQQSPSIVVPSVPLADKNWFQTGGNAKYFAEPTTPEEFKEALFYAATHDLKLCVMGEGANMLIADQGVEALVIRPQLKTIRRYDYDNEYACVEAGAGVSFGNLISWCLDNNIIGLEEFSGIPGTVGGAVFINIHYFEYLLSQFLIGAQVIEKATGELKIVTNAWFNFGYNTSRLHDGTHYLVSATFKLKTAPAEIAMHAKGRSEEMIRHRAKRYPTSRTCGSFFRNFHEEEVANTPKQLIYVAYYLDKVGIKGELSVGGACVSYQHANMIVNQGNATTQDIVDLALLMQQKVQEAFGIVPQPECRFIGFDNYPLLP